MLRCCAVALLLVVAGCAVVLLCCCAVGGWLLVVGCWLLVVSCCGPHLGQFGATASRFGPLPRTAPPWTPCVGTELPSEIQNYALVFLSRHSFHTFFDLVKFSVELCWWFGRFGSRKQCKTHICALRTCCETPAACGSRPGLHKVFREFQNSSIFVCCRLFFNLGSTKHHTNCTQEPQKPNTKQKESL